MRIKPLLQKRARRAFPNRPRRAVPSFVVFFSSLLGRVVSGCVLVSLIAAGATLVLLMPTETNASATDGVRDQNPASSIADIAKDREASLSLDGKAITASNTENSMANRQLQLAYENQAILDEAERLERLSEFMWPVDGELSPGNGYGMRLHPILRRYRMHDGVDISAKCGQPIYASQSGTVVNTTSGYSGGSGISAKIAHGKFEGIQVTTAYLHMSKLIVSQGDKVEKGQEIGYVGSTGLSTGCHLHLSLYKDGSSANPLEYVKR